MGPTLLPQGPGDGYYTSNEVGQKAMILINELNCQESLGSSFFRIWFFISIVLDFSRIQPIGHKFFVSRLVSREHSPSVSHTVIGLLDQLFYCFESQRVRGRAETGYLRLRSLEYDPKWEFRLFVDTNDLSL